MGKRRVLYRGLAVAAAILFAAPGAIAKPSEPFPAPVCSESDLSFEEGVTYKGCSGFYYGNLLAGNGTTMSQVQTIIDGFSIELGETFTYLGGWLDKFDGVDGNSTTVTFGSLVKGPVVVGLKFGIGAAYRSDPDSTRIFDTGTGGGTAFYFFDTGEKGIQGFNLNISSLSGVSVVTAVPEPEIYATMAIGLGLIGFMARRRRKTG